MDEKTIQLDFDTSELDEVIKKTEQIKKHMEKAMELANSIASMNLDVRVNAVINDKTAELARITAE